ncbi:MAG: hypothetical protein AB7U35_13250 [Sphingobium sp.]
MSKSIWSDWDVAWQGVSLAEAKLLNAENARAAKLSDEARRPIAASFMRQGRWTLLSVLVWIATRSPMLASYGEERAMSSRSVALAAMFDRILKQTRKVVKTTRKATEAGKKKAHEGLARRAAEWLDETWRLLVEQAIKHGIVAACDSVAASDDAVVVLKRGQSFPPVDEPKAWLTYAPSMIGSDLVLIPGGLNYGRTDGFANVTFDSASIQLHWSGNHNPFAVRAPVGRPSKVPQIIARIEQWSEAERQQPFGKKVEQLRSELKLGKISERTVRKAINQMDSGKHLTRRSKRRSYR